MDKENKPNTPTPTPKSTAAAPRKTLTLNATAFQKKLSTISVNNILERRTRLRKNA